MHCYLPLVPSERYCSYFEALFSCSSSPYKSSFSSNLGHIVGAITPLWKGNSSQQSSVPLSCKSTTTEEEREDPVTSTVFATLSDCDLYINQRARSPKRYIFNASWPCDSDCGEEQKVWGCTYEIETCRSENEMAHARLESYAEQQKSTHGPACIVHILTSDEGRWMSVHSHLHRIGTP